MVILTNFCTEAQHRAQLVRRTCQEESGQLVTLTAVQSEPVIVLKHRDSRLSDAVQTVAVDRVRNLRWEKVSRGANEWSGYLHVTRGSGDEDIRRHAVNVCEYF